MKKEEFLNIIKEIEENESLMPDEIPDMPLYMEQLTTYFDNRHKLLKRTEDEKILTKSMINNYTKEGLLMAPVRKKYESRHIILLSLIYSLKNILSLQDIKSLLAPVLNSIETEEDDIIKLDEIYKNYLEIKRKECKDLQNEVNNSVDRIRKKTKDLSGKNKEKAELFLFVLGLIAKANVQKRLAEKVLDKYFNNPD
jgi:DNA-binding transcriptional MerR regulator